MSESDSDSWQLNKQVVDCNKYMLEHQIATDVKFKVSNNLNSSAGRLTHTDRGNNAEEEDTQRGTDFHAHKYMLISRSPVFYTMFCGEMAERGDIVVEDVEPEAFQQLLNYIYTDQVMIDKDWVMFILYAAEKYMLPGLTNKCISYLLKHLEASNACLILDQSILFGVERLIDECMKIIMYDTKTAMESPPFLNIQVDTLSYLLNAMMFSIPEVQVYLKCIEWAKAQCESQNIEVTGENIRTKLGKCVYQISFSCIKSEDFTCVVSPDKVLKADEELKFLRYFCSQSEPSGDLQESHAHKDNVCNMPEEFNSVDRYLRVDKIRQVSTVMTDENFKTIPSLESGEYTFKFTQFCKQSISLRGFILCKFPASYADVFYNWQNCVVVHNHREQVFGTFYTPGHGKWKEIDLQHPLELPAGSNTIRLSFKVSLNSNCWNGNEGICNVVRTAKLRLSDKFINIKIENPNGIQEIPICGITYSLTSDVVSKYM